MIKSYLERKLKSFIYFLIITLVAFQSANAMFTDENEEVIERAAWKKYVCCCWPPSRNEKAEHYFKKGQRLYDESTIDMRDAIAAMNNAALYGHPNAVAKATEFASYNPVIKGIEYAEKGYRTYQYAKVAIELIRKTQ